MSKEILVAVLVVIALGLVYFYVLAPQAEVVEPPIDPIDNPVNLTNETVVDPIPNENVTKLKDVFLKNLQESNETYIIMDVEGIEDQVLKESVLQCGIDLAASPGLALKNITTLAFENGECFGLGNLTISECISATSDTPTFYANSVNETFYFEKMLMIKVDDKYAQGSCSVGLMVDEPYNP